MNPVKGEITDPLLAGKLLRFLFARDVGLMKLPSDLTDAGGPNGGGREKDLIDSPARLNGFLGDLNSVQKDGDLVRPDGIAVPSEEAVGAL